MAVPLPTSTTRWRCARCGNLTRFDVVRTSRVVDYVHVDLAGRAQIEERKVLTETVERVRCRWCDADDAVELVARPHSGVVGGDVVDGDAVGRASTDRVGGGVDRAGRSPGGTRERP